MHWFLHIFCLVYLQLEYIRNAVGVTKNPRKFPIGRLFGLNNETSITLSKLLCHDSKTRVYQKKCNCKKNCMISRSCCIDYLWDKFPSVELPEYLGKLVNVTNQYKDLSCKHIFPSLTFDSDSVKLLIVKSCTNSKNSLRCLNETDTSLEAQFPVFGEDNYLYRNKFCAQCNSVNYNLVPWLEPGRQRGPGRRVGTNLRDIRLYISAQCKEVTNTISSLNGKSPTNHLQETFSGCFYSIDGDSSMRSYLHSCYNNTCDYGNDVYNLCHSYAAPMLNYQNYHCFKCNENPNILSTLSLINSIKYDKRTYSNSLWFPEKDKLIYPWTFKLSLNDNNTVEVSNIERVFPFLEIFNISHPYNVRNGRMLEEYSCSSKDYRRQCSCSSDCMKDKGCCVDVFWDNKNPMQFELYIEMFFNESKKYKDLSCEYILPAVVNKDGDMERIFMVKSCLYYKNATRCLKETDTSLEAIFPVFGDDNYLYRNRYCAECNGISLNTRRNSTNLRFRYSVKCQEPIKANRSLTSKSSLNELQDVFRHCFYLLDKSDSITQRYLYTCYNNTCHPENKHYNLCRSYKAPEMNYQNIHCFQCNVHSNRSNKCPRGTCNLNARRNLILYPWSYKIHLNDDNIIEVSNAIRQFPLVEFFNIPKGNIKVTAKSLSFYSCTSGESPKCCNCADDCMESHTCCIDKLWDPAKPTSLQSYLDMFLEKSREYRQQVCEYILPYVINHGHESKMYMMTKSCKKDAKMNDITNCINNHNNSLDLLIPVFGTDRYLYRNKYCALCNFMMNFTYVDIRGDCAGKLQSEVAFNDTINATDVFLKCTFKIVAGNSREKFIHYCPRQMKWNKECGKNNTDYNMCKAYTGDINGYANFHCLKCNSQGLVVPKLFFCNSRGMFKLLKSRPFLPWSLLISSSGLNVLHKAPSLKPRGVYLHTVTNVVNPSFDNCLQKRNPTFLISYANNKSYVMSFINQFRSELHIFGVNTSIYYQGKTIFISLNGSKYVNIENIYRFISIYQVSNQSIFQHVDWFILNYIKDYPDSSPYNWDFSTLYPDGRRCAESIRLNENVNFTTKCDALCNGTFINQSNISMWVEFRKKYVTRNLFTCNRFYLHSQCTLKKLSQNDFQVNGSKYLLHKEDKTKVYPVEQYIPLQNEFGVCMLPKDDYPKWMTLLLAIEGYISIICTSISICCYVVIIVTFYAYKQLRNAGGLVGLSMCSCLLVTDSLYLTTNIIYRTSANIFKLCAAVGIMMHYGLLTAHMWSLLIAFDIASKFHGLHVTQREIKRFYKSCGFAFGVPLLIIVLCLILNFNDILYFGYGDRNICFIIGFTARLIFYIIPVALIWLMNIILFIYSIIQITRKKKGNDAALGKSNRANFNIISIAARLLLTFGFSEVFGFISIPNANHNDSKMIFNSIFSFFYTLLRSARGFLLLMVYVWRRQVILLYKQSINEHCSHVSLSEMKEERREKLTLEEEIRQEMKTCEEQVRHEMKTSEGQVRHEMKTSEGQVRHEKQTSEEQARHEKKTSEEQVRLEMKMSEEQVRHEMKTSEGQVRHEMKTSEGQVRYEKQTSEEQARHEKQKSEEQVRPEMKTPEEQVRHEKPTWEEKVRYEKQTSEEQVRHEEQMSEEQVDIKRKTRGEQVRLEKQKLNEHINV